MPVNVPEVSAQVRCADLLAAAERGDEPRPVLDLIWMPMR